MDAAQLAARRAALRRELGKVEVSGWEQFARRVIETWMWGVVCIVCGQRECECQASEADRGRA